MGTNLCRLNATQSLIVCVCALAATFYGPERINEKLIAQQLPSCPQFQVGVKVGVKGYLGSSDFGVDASPDSLCEAVESSLKILGRDSLDLVIQARQAPDTPIETVMQTFKELVQEGARGCSPTFCDHAVQCVCVRCWVLHGHVAPANPCLCPSLLLVPYTVAWVGGRLHADHSHAGCGHQRCR